MSDFRKITAAEANKLFNARAKEIAVPTLIYATGSLSFEKFLTVYEPGLAVSWANSSGKNLLHYAIGNTDPVARVAIANHLLDDGADAATVSGPEGYTALHILFGANAHDFPAEALLLERLLAGGADVNGVARKWGTPIQTLASVLKFSDGDLAPFYDVIFARHDLDLMRPGRGGRSTLEDTRLMTRWRTGLLSRMETYLHQHGQPTDDR